MNRRDILMADRMCKNCGRPVEYIREPEGAVWAHKLTLEDSTGLVWCDPPRGRSGGPPRRRARVD